LWRRARARRSAPTRASRGSRWMTRGNRRRPRERRINCDRHGPVECRSEAHAAGSRRSDAAHTVVPATDSAITARRA
jgi:hypothetical protein